MEKTNAFVIGTLTLMVLLIAGVICAYVWGGLDFLCTAIIVVLVIVIAAFLIMYFVFGTYYFVKQKDATHLDSGLSLDDVTEVDREMEKK